eukprot:CAMPEP_0174252942 /NCGR_PEP_ID=MMETSP0439-20130205/2320_1 /TAXON_ID=0 /ORGANISM="Stereomyxa ramosa, Strain Chinc5" /LENGTH=80 /DNA_ID=CAMNT_0015333669 /DNA_START=13 /DNA_END=251 /DNA_ORIENTATION=+
MATDYSVDEELQKLYAIVENEMGVSDGGTFTFKQIFEAEKGRFESLVGTIIAAKKKGIFTYNSPMGNLLLQGAHDDVVIT